jgi:hypothetical protein
MQERCQYLMMGTIASQTPEYVYSQQAIPGASNWVQLGPTAVPGGQTLSTYYNIPNIPALVTGRVISIVVDPSDTAIIYVGTAQGGDSHHSFFFLLPSW